MSHKHNRTLTKKIEFFTNFSNNTFVIRFKYIYRHRQTIDDFKMNENIFRWFRTNSRSSKSTNAFDNYRFFHIEASAYRVFWKILQTSNFSKIDMNLWQVKNNIVRGNFKWSFNFKRIIFDCLETNIKEIALIEYEMYFHHHREIMNKNILKWFKFIIYFLTQQTMRQNSHYYRIYVVLRFDHAWKLISYSYYIKYAKIENNIYFRHFDQNIFELLTTKKKKYDSKHFFVKRWNVW